jgi:hypothetical protein
MEPRQREEIACALDPTGVRGQLDEWARLRPWFRRAEASGHGVRLWFDATVEAQLLAVAHKEAACCGFLAIQVVRERDVVRLEITSEHTDARSVIEMLASYASERDSTG